MRAYNDAAMSNKQYSASEIATRYGVKLSTVNAWVQSGKINCVKTKVGLVYRRLITLADLTEFEQKYDIKPV
jgi:predicted site-specific integrase-resolvase